MPHNGRVSWEIRGATESDADAIGLFQTQCWREAYRGLVPDAFLAAMSVEQRRVRWAHRLSVGERVAAVAWSGGDVAGVVSWADDRVEAAVELKTLYVGAAYRGAGLATALMTRAVGAGAAHLSVFEGNTRAERFYAKSGFRPNGKRSLDAETGLTEIHLVRAASPPAKNTANGPGIRHI